MRILLVDSDREAILKSAEALCRQYPGAELVSTTDAMDAVRYSLNNPIDIVYTEVMMPRCSGFDVVRLARKFHPGVQAYILSDTDKFAAQAQRYKIGKYLLKRSFWAMEAGRDANELTEDELDLVAAAGDCLYKRKLD